MYAMFAVLRKGEGTTAEAFRAWWLEQHAPRVEALPGLRHYLLIPSDHGYSTVTQEWTEYPQYDGLAVIVFDSADALRNGLALLASGSGNEAGHTLEVSAANMAGTPVVKVGSLLLAPAGPRHAPGQAARPCSQYHAGRD